MPPNSRHLTSSRGSRYLPAHLNRQIITILSSLGIPDEVFLDYQMKMLQSSHQLFSTYKQVPRRGA